MGVFDWLFGRLRYGHEAEPGIKVTTMLRAKGHTPTFTTETHIVEKAFDQIIADVDIPKDVARKLRPQFVAAHQSGDPRKETEVLKDTLGRIEWGEKYFNAWRERFISEGTFPYMWRTHAETLIKDVLQPPGMIGDALEYLRVADMRNLLVELDAIPAKGKPKKRADFENLLQSTGATDVIVQAALPRYEDALIDFSARRESQKYKILAHALSKRAYALRDRYNWSRLNTEKKVRPLRSDCPVETAYATRFMDGKICGDPPFFPGDRTGFVVDRKGGL